MLYATNKVQLELYYYTNEMESFFYNTIHIFLLKLLIYDKDACVYHVTQMCYAPFMHSKKE
jgi:hypothetical protein